MSQRGSGRGGGRGGDRGRGGGDRGRGGGGDRGRGGGGYGGGERGRGGGGFGGGDRGRGGGRGGGGGGYAPRDDTPPEVFGDGAFPPPESNVTQLENQFMTYKSTAGGSISGLSVSDEIFPTRPAYGTKGRPVVLWSNYFNLIPPKDLVLFRHKVSVLPESPKGRKLRRIFQLLLEDPRFIGAATDFKDNLINRTRIEEMEVNIIYRAELEDEPLPDAKKYRVKIQPTGELEIGDFLARLRSAQASNPNFGSDKTNQFFQGLNIILGHYPQSRPDEIATVASNKHYHFGEKLIEWDLGGGLQALRGYFRSVRMGTGRMLVNVNVSHAVFFRPGPLRELINVFFSSIGGENWYQAERFLKKVRVKLTHLPVKKNKSGKEIPRFKTIIGLANNNDGQQTTKGSPKLEHPPQVGRFPAGPKDVKFWFDTEAQGTSSSSKSGAKDTPGKPGAKKASPKAFKGYISVYDYFQKYHNITLKFPNLPIFNLGTKENPMYMPVEYLEVLPGQSSMKKLSPDQTASMIRFACRKPFLNAKSITEDGPDVIGLPPSINPLLASFGVSIKNQMITVPGRVLNAPQIKYAGSSSENPRFGSWNMARVKFTAGASVPRWSWLWIKRHGRPGQVERFNLINDIIEQFGTMMRNCGLTVPPVLPGHELVLDNRADPVSNDDKIQNFLKRADASGIALMFVLLPDTDVTVYNKIKQVGDVTVGVHTVCAVDNKVSKDKGREQYLANVALKVNAKFNGINQSLDMSKLGIIAEGKTMVVGIDVTHPSPGSLSTAPSVAAVVASTDKYLAQFPCELSIQGARVEMVGRLGEMFKSRLDLWRAKNKVLPENILVYRDGVSEGQYRDLKDIEIPALRQTCDLLYTSEQRKKGLPKLSVIVVGKRHHTRFYSTQKGDMDRSGNPGNGTVVDRGVTSMWNWDFFLQAHACLQGTAKPAHYYVVQDEIFGRGALKKPHPFPNAADSLEDLTHNMCYLFTRATKAVSICPPAYYADLACERARCYLSGVFDPATPGGSTTTGAAAAQPTTSHADIATHPRLRNSMFYI